MPKAYYYQPSHVPMREFPPGYFKFDPALIEITENPADADLFVLPTDLRHVTDQQIEDLPFLNPDTAAHHVFFSLSEFPTRALPPHAANALAFRTDHNKTLATVNPRARSHPWGVEDLGRYVDVPEFGYVFDIHAQLWSSTPMTDQAVESCVRAGLIVHDQRNPFFYGTLETAQDPRLANLRRTFLENMYASRLVLVPRSRPAVNRYRFFEALSMGRVPVLLGDDVLLPCADKIDYDRCCVRIGEALVDTVGHAIVDFLTQYSDAQILEMGAYGRESWLRWLNPARWETTWAELAIEHLERFNE